MSDYRRVYIPGGTFFFTLNLFDRSSDLLVRHIEDLRASWRDVRETRPFETPAIVVLPDHFHMIMTLPEGDADYSTRMRLIKAGFTKRLPERIKSDGRKGERNVWQRRFWEHAIRNEADYDAHVDYIHSNPVKHGLVATPDDWPHSTWHRYKREYGYQWRPG